MVQEVEATNQATSFQLVGRFLFEFALLETEVNKGIGKLFGLDDGRTSILAANIDFSRKVKILFSAESYIGESPDKTRAELVKRTRSKVLELNTNRVMLAHSLFEARPGNKVMFYRVVADDKLNVSEIVWDHSNFESRFLSIQDVRAWIVQIVETLKPYSPSLDFSDPRNSQYLSLIFGE